MAKGQKPTREEQIALMVGVEERVAGHLQNWINDAEFKASLHRYDHCDDGPVKRAVNGR